MVKHSTVTELKEGLSRCSSLVEELMQEHSAKVPLPVIHASLYRSKELAYCQPGAFWHLARKLPRLVSAKELHKTKQSVIGVHEGVLSPQTLQQKYPGAMSLSDTQLKGLMAAEVEHAYDYHAATSLDLLSFGFDYLLYELTPNTTPLESRLGAVASSMACYEKLLDLRAIDRGSGEYLLAFREAREQIATPLITSTYDRSEVYLGVTEIKYYIDHESDRSNAMHALENHLGITSKKPLGSNVAVRALLGKTNPSPSLEYVV